MHTRSWRGTSLRRLSLALAGLLVAAPSEAAPLPAGEPVWHRVDTPNFVVIGTGSDKSLTETGLQFEGFREALSRLVSPTATATAVPTIVIVFPNDKTLEPFRPMFNGSERNRGCPSRNSSRSRMTLRSTTRDCAGRSSTRNRGC